MRRVICDLARIFKGKHFKLAVGTLRNFEKAAYFGRALRRLLINSFDILGNAFLETPILVTRSLFARNLCSKNKRKSRERIIAYFLFCHTMTPFFLSK